METKEQLSMKRHRAVILGLGLAALIGLSAPEARAATLTMNIIYAGSTFSFTGTADSVNPALATINSDLAGSGYSFSGLGGSSNNSFTTTSAFVSQAYDLSFTPGGAGGALQIQTTESGFTAPAASISNTLTASQGATFTSATTISNSANVGLFADGGGPFSASPGTLFGTTSQAQSSNATTGIPTYSIPFALTSTATINLNAASGAPLGNLVGTSTVTITAIPEPASVILMLTGMPLPLVLLGLLRRRRAAA
jgi:hypothetical protein